mmetsp:Transcript_13266/g.24896  ORF Transcript_13266/g.24896 Transcript_13266/m.24896 type:complete len:813 (-) Transcript_13266:811-3249(-)|eukprot:CAMPEP_0176481510 /NCGR_PEP_ID=MMETSP0200_2-20121128/2865_1 /TAXON_ID=947934 /ORGANISM="Chaetoceros sp., Strain GSL56" /LENGTH=812 /DNA_ID=CAMNT_0017877733 /DNA_START=83 /DNA_END=2521 /DNA_ORIENTATION=-
MGTTQSSKPELQSSFQPPQDEDRTSQVQKDHLFSSSCATTTARKTNNNIPSNGRNKQNDNDTIREKALYLMCSCPCSSTVYDSTTNNTTFTTSTSTSTSLSENAASNFLMSDDNINRKTTKTTTTAMKVSNGLCFSDTTALTEDVNDQTDNETNTSLPFSLRRNDNTTTTTTITTNGNTNYNNDGRNNYYNYNRPKTKKIQVQHSSNINDLNLDRVHPSKGPYLGTISWEPQSPMECSKSLLDISHHDPHEEEEDDDDGNVVVDDDDDNIDDNVGIGIGIDIDVGDDKGIHFENNHDLQEEGVIQDEEFLKDRRHDPVTSSWQSISPIPSTSSPFECTSTVQKGKIELDATITATPSKSGDEIEISFMPPKRLFHESFTDLNNHGHDHDRDHDHGDCHDSHEAKDQSPSKDVCTTLPCQTTMMSPSNNVTTTTTTRRPQKSIVINNNGILSHLQNDTSIQVDCEQQDPLLPPPPSSTPSPPPQQYNQNHNHNATTISSITMQSSDTINGCNAPHPPDGVYKWGMMHINTLPSFTHGRPIRLKMKESYRGYETRVVGGNEGHLDDDNDHDVILDLSNLSLLSDATQQEHFFSYDPYFSLGQYVINTVDDGQYGNGLCVQMGERYMTLQDQNERVWGVIRSRHTWIPSAVIYSPKQRFCGQTASSHQPLENIASHGGYGGVELYPWALVKKHGRRMDHDVTIHMVAEPNVSGGGGGGGGSFNLLGGLFEKRPVFRSRHGFDGVGNHQSTVVYRVARDDIDSGLEKEYPCCKSVRDAIQKDLFHVTIAPGIDPLLIICYMVAHSKMDVEPKLCDE